MGGGRSVEHVTPALPPLPPLPAPLRDIGRLADFMELFCQKKHPRGPHRRVQASGCVEPYLRKRSPTLCARCTRLFLHGAAKRVLCPYEKRDPAVPKPNCADCEIHCFPGDYRVAMREVMRFSGWRLIVRGRLDLIPGMLGLKK